MLKNIYYPISLIFFLSACSADYKKLNNGNYSSKNPFYNTLILEYKKQADFEAKEMHDWNSAKLYSIKAIKSSKEKNIKPEKISNWIINEKKAVEINKAYDNLMAVYEKGLAKDPVNLAKAIVFLDCWAEQEEEGWQLDHINNCKSKHLNAVHLIYENISEEVEKNNIVNNSDSSIIIKKKNNDIEKIIYFDFDHFNLNSENKSELKVYFSEINMNKYEYLVVGHTDTKGKKEYNYQLSIKRANSVKKLLNKLGIEINRIKVIGKGESNLAIQTPDETEHPANRRAVIKTSY